LHHVRKNPPPHKICIIYMYYSPDNDRIARHIPYFMLDDETMDLKNM